MRSKFALLNNQLEKSYGLNVNYKSMSPSILTGINIKSIEIQDTNSGEKFVLIKKAIAKYSIEKVFKRDFENAISEIVIFDVEANFIQGKNTAWTNFLFKQNSDFENILEMINSSEVELKLPFDISINNFKFLFQDEKSQLEFSTDIRKLYLEKTAFDLKHNLELLGKINLKYKQNNFSSTIILQSSLLSKIENSTAVIRFYNSNINSYVISEVGFLTEFSNSILSLKMLPSVQNIYAEVFANLNSKDVNLNFDCNNFRISNLIKEIKKNSVLKNFENFLLTTNASALYNFKTSKFSYVAKGKLGIPEKYISHGANVNFAFNGNQSFVNVSTLHAENENIDAEFSGRIAFFKNKFIEPTGTLFINKIVLKNEEQLSADFFIEPLDNGLMFFSPEIVIGEKTFTAAQFNLNQIFDGYDFDFEVYDYSHIESGDAGRVKFIGNYLTSSKFLQTNISLEGLYIDSVLETASCFLEKGLSSFVKDTAPVFKNTIFTTDIYLTSYNKNFSYSVPSVLIADTLSDNKMLSFSIDGNKENIQVNNFEFVFNEQKILASAHSENIFESENRQMQTILTCNVEYNSIPYSFSGLINKNWFSLTGDYGFDLSIMLDSETENLLGDVALKEFPLKINENIISLSTQSNFYYNAQEKINLNISNFVIQGIEGVTNNLASFAFSGKVDKNGAFFEQINYTDIASNLTGSGSVIWNFLQADFLNATYDISLSDLLYNEQISFSGEVSNPEQLPFSTQTLLNDFYISSMINVSNFRTGRFVGDFSSTDIMNAQLSITGILANPLISIIVPRGTVSINNVPLTFSLFASVVDLEFELESANIKWGNVEVKNIKSNFSFNDWKGFLSFDTATSVMQKTLFAPVKISFEGNKNPESKSFFPENFNLEIFSPKLTGTFVKTTKPLLIQIAKIQDEILIDSTKNIGLKGSVLPDGNFSFIVENQVPFNFKVSGNTKKKNADIKVFDIEVDLPKTLKLINYPILKVYNGKLIGDFKITGNHGNKGFDGALQIIPAEFSMPEYFTHHAKTDIIYITMTKDSIYTPQTRCQLNHALVDVTVIAPMNNLVPDSVSFLVKTVDDDFAPININLDQVHVKGNAQTDLDITVESDLITVLGSIVTKDTSAEFGATTFEEVVSTFTPQENIMPHDVQVMLDVKMLSRVQVFYSSFLRGLVVPNSDVVFKYSSADDKMTLDGDVLLRSGEIIYLNSSFYIKNGRLQFAESDGNINPYVSIEAETRERDTKGEDVKISLSVEHQRISDLSPKLTSSPAKSEKEIMELLGNFVSAKSDDVSEFMLATGDYALQTVVMRKVENALRDLLNFDILSIRTMVVQNALKYSISRDDDRQGMKIGNFFDNTTVYIGKYFGKDLYTDAMLRLSYDKNRINDDSTWQGFMFKPEFGIEMESPIAKLRWSVAPDLSELKDMRILFVPSLTLSWRFNF